MKKIYWLIIILLIIFSIYIFWSLFHVFVVRSRPHLIEVESNPILNANFEEPLVNDNLTAKAGRKNPFRLSFYNFYDKELINVKPYIASCNKNANLSIIAISAKIAANTEMKFNTLVTVLNETSPGEYICNLTIGTDNIPNAFSKLVTINVI